MRNLLPIIIIVVILGIVVSILKMGEEKEIPVTIVATNFEECVGMGNPVMESYPRQCSSGGKTFTENIGNELEKANLIRITTPRPNTVITSPLVIRGEARGGWFFEASFPIDLKDANGVTIAQWYATVQADPATGEVNWMTSEFVPFESTLIFENPTSTQNRNGTLILRKDNASGLPEHDDSLEIPIIFGE